MDRRNFCLAALAGIWGMATAAFAGGTLDGNWILTEAGGKRIAADSLDRTPNFRISGNEISGFDGCNQFGGRLDRPGEIVATRMACLGDYIELPLDLDDAGAHLKKAKLNGDTMRLPAAGRFPASVFKRR